MSLFLFYGIVSYAVCFRLLRNKWLYVFVIKHRINNVYIRLISIFGEIHNRAMGVQLQDAVLFIFSFRILLLFCYHQMPIFRIISNNCNQAGNAVDYMQYPNRAVAFTVEMQPHTLSINYIVKMNNWSILQTNIINFVSECYTDSNIPYYI